MTEKRSVPLATKLKELRKNFCMTQDDIAELLDMSRTSFSKYENGAANPPLSVLRKLSAIYNVPLEYLIHDETTKMVFHSSDEPETPEVENQYRYFSQLTKEERKLILKLRLMKKEKKAEIIRAIEFEDEE